MVLSPSASTSSAWRRRAPATLALLTVLAFHALTPAAGAFVGKYIQGRA